MVSCGCAVTNRFVMIFVRLSFITLLFQIMSCSDNLVESNGNLEPNYYGCTYSLRPNFQNYSYNDQSCFRGEFGDAIWELPVSCILLGRYREYSVKGES